VKRVQTSERRVSEVVGKAHRAFRHDGVGEDGAVVEGNQEIQWLPRQSRRRCPRQKNGKARRAIPTSQAGLAACLSHQSFFGT
jgi:hypothetical protein